MDPTTCLQVFTLAVFQTFWLTILVCQSSLLKGFRDFWFEWAMDMDRFQPEPIEKKVLFRMASLDREGDVDTWYDYRVLDRIAYSWFYTKKWVVDHLSDLFHCSFCMSFWQALAATSFAIWFFNGSWWLLLGAVAVAGAASALGRWQPVQASHPQEPRTVGKALKLLDD